MGGRWGSRTRDTTSLRLTMQAGRLHGGEATHCWRGTGGKKSTLLKADPEGEGWPWLTMCAGCHW